MSLKLFARCLVPASLLALLLGCAFYVQPVPVQIAEPGNSVMERNLPDDSPAPQTQMLSRPIPPEPWNDPESGLPPTETPPMLAPAFATLVNPSLHTTDRPLPTAPEEVKRLLKSYVTARFGTNLRQVSVLGPGTDVYLVKIADVRDPFGRDSQQVFDIEYLVAIQRSIPQVVIAGVCKYRKHRIGFPPGEWKPCLDHDGMAGDLKVIAGGMADCLIEGACTHGEDQ